jgi:hypothetical protein
MDEREWNGMEKRDGDERRFGAGTRSGDDRREKPEDWKFLEKRSGQERRAGDDRRKIIKRRTEEESE